MSTVQREINDGTVLVFTKGAPDVLLGRCDRVQVGESAIEFAEPIRQRALADVDLLTSQAYRTLGVAYRAVASTETPGESTEYGLVFAGLVGIIDPPRSEVAPAIAEAHRAGIRTIMITGDHPATAARIATDLGIASPGTPAMTGQQLDALDAGGLRQAARTISVFARVAPRHKLLLVDGHQADGHIVAMTGDGVNDAPALKSADIGIAMGITGTEVTREAATMFLPGGLIEGHDTLAVARTAGFTTLVLTQLVNAFNSRSETTSAFRRAFFNRWLLGSVVLAVILQVPWSKCRSSTPRSGQRHSISRTGECAYSRRLPCSGPTR